MDGPSPIIHNLLFEEATKTHPAQISFTYIEDGKQKDMTFTIVMVRKDLVRIQHASGTEETFYATCEYTTLFLGEENLQLFIQWARRNGLPHGSQLISK